MFIVRFIANTVIFAIELAAVVGVAWLGWRYPMALAALAGALSLVMGLWLERARIRNELGFYFGRGVETLSGNVASTVIAQSVGYTATP